MSAGNAGLPGRPRLADHALPRRHFIDGEEVVVVHDARSGDLVRMPPRAWALIEAADGTRDLGGLLLAASQRGELRRSSEVVSVLTDLHAAGLLTDGIDPFALEPPPPACDPATPLDVLPFSLVCDGSGSCCATYSTVRFTAEEAERARALLPGASDGRARTFLPLAGSGAQRARAATAIDGACAYLATDGACELHRTHGAAAKPEGCAIYPATFVFDGEAVRVSLGVECACIAKSLGRTDGAPLVPERAATAADLPAEAQVVALPDAIEIRPGVTAPRDALVRWSRAVLRAIPSRAPRLGAMPSRAARPASAATAGSTPAAASAPDATPATDATSATDATPATTDATSAPDATSGAPDAAAILWSLAARVEGGDLSEEGVRAAIAGASPPDAGALAPWIAALAERAAAKHESAERWRGRNDRVRLASEVLARAAAALVDRSVLARAIAGEGAPRALEALYVTAALHGHALLGEVPLAHALRDRAVRVLLARALPAFATGAPLDVTHPLPLVEAMMRAQGVKAYARMIEQ